MTLEKRHNSTKGDNSDLKKLRVTYFLMRNRYMKFKNCILINFVKNSRTHARTNKAKAICHFNVSKVGGIKSSMFYSSNHVPGL